MSDEKNTNEGEQVIDTEGGEQVSTQEDGNSSEGGENEESRKAAEREKAKQGMKDKVPDWLKQEIRDEAQQDFDQMYSTRRDKELYEQNLPKVVKENNLSAEEQKVITDEVENLRKYKDDQGNTMSYEQALRLATKDLNSTTLKQAVKIAAGALPPSGGQQADVFNTVSVSKFDAMSPVAQKAYMAKSKELHGAVKFT